MNPLHALPPLGFPVADGLVASPMNAQEVAWWAERVHVPVEQLVLAITAGSEVGPEQGDEISMQQQLVMHALLNRRGWSGFRNGFPGRPDSLFSIAVAPATTTGPQGAGGREFSTSRIYVGVRMAYLLAVAAHVLEARARGENGGGVVSFAHKTPHRLVKLETRWNRLGYVRVATFHMANGLIGAYFAPTPAKAKALTAAAQAGTQDRARPRGRRPLRGAA